MARKKWEIDLKVIRDILRLASEERYTYREIGTSLSVSHQTVSKHINTIAKSGLDIARALELNDQELKEILYPKAPGPISEEKVTPDFDALIKEMAKAPISHTKGTLGRVQGAVRRSKLQLLAVLCNDEFTQKSELANYAS